MEHTPFLSPRCDKPGITFEYVTKKTIHPAKHNEKPYIHGNWLECSLQRNSEDNGGMIPNNNNKINKKQYSQHSQCSKEKKIPLRNELVDKGNF